MQSTLISVPVAEKRMVTYCQEIYFLHFFPRKFTTFASPNLIIIVYTFLSALHLRKYENILQFIFYYWNLMLSWLLLLYSAAIFLLLLPMGWNQCCYKVDKFAIFSFSYSIVKCSCITEISLYLVGSTTQVLLDFITDLIVLIHKCLTLFCKPRSGIVFLRGTSNTGALPKVGCPKHAKCWLAFNTRRPWKSGSRTRAAFLHKKERYV